MAEKTQSTTQGGGATAASDGVTAAVVASHVSDAGGKASGGGNNPKLRIKLRSYDLKMLESAVTKILGLLMKSGASIKGPIPLPKKKKKYTVIKSHFVYKDGREQFERITYARLIDVVETGPKTVEYLQNLSIPVGISVEVRVY